MKLALGYTAVIISAITFAFDYKLGFEKTKYWTAAAVVVYFLLNGAFTYWIWAVEKGVVFLGSWKGKQVGSPGTLPLLVRKAYMLDQLVISSKTDKSDPTYHLTARFDAKESQIAAPFMQWFTADGYFVAKPFQQWLASSIPVIGEADPKNAAADNADSAAASTDGLATGSSKESGKKASRRKG